VGIGASGVSGSGVGCDELDSLRVVVRIPSQNPLISRFSAHRASLPGRAEHVASDGRSKGKRRDCGVAGRGSGERPSGSV
jgi:hypothetical protein